MIHLTLQQLSAYLDDELPEASVELVRRHLSQCPECTVRFAKVEALEEILVRLLHHDPGDAFFDFFRDSITFDDGGAHSHAKRAPAAKAHHAAKEPPAAKAAAREKAAPAAKAAAREKAAAGAGSSAAKKAAAKEAEERVAREQREAEERAAKERLEAEGRAVRERLEAEERAARERREAAERAARELREEEERLAKARREEEERLERLRREEEERARLRREEEERLAKARREEELRLAEALREKQRREQEALRERQRLEQEELLAKLSRSAEPRAVSPALYGRREEDRKPGRSGGATAGWIAAAILLVVGASIAAIVAGTRPKASPDASVSAPSQAPAPAGATTPAEPPAPADEAASGPVATPAAGGAGATIERNEPEEPVTVSAASVPEDEPAPPAPSPAPVPTKRAPAPRQKSAETPAAATTPERLVERAPRNMVPVRTIVTTTNLEPATESGASQAGDRTNASGATGDALAPAAAAAQDARRAFERAKRLSLDAAGRKSASAYESAAAAWDDALPGLAGVPEDEALARRELAQARFQAWAIEPTPARRESAVRAARAYLLFAPPGPDRDQAWTWLGRLKH